MTTNLNFMKAAELLLARMFVDAVNLIRETVAGAQPGQIEQWIEHSKAQPQMTTLVHDLLTGYPDVLLGVPILMSGTPLMGKAAAVGYLPRPRKSLKNSQYSDNLEFMGWLDVDAPLSANAVSLAAEPLPIEADTTRCVVALFRSSGNHAHNLPGRVDTRFFDELFQEELMDWDFLCCPGELHTYPVARDMGRAMLAKHNGHQLPIAWFAPSSQLEYVDTFCEAFQAHVEKHRPGGRQAAVR